MSHTNPRHPSPISAIPSGQASQATSASQGKQLASSLPYVQALHGQRVMVVYAGQAVFEPTSRAAFAQDIAMLSLLGAQPMLVHGGAPSWQPGSPAGRGHLAEALALPVKRAALAEINRDLVQLISRQGPKTLGLAGQDGHCLQAAAHGAAGVTGVAGTIATLDMQLPELLLQNGMLPVLMPVAPDADGQDHLLAPETLGATLAQQLAASTLVILTDSTAMHELAHANGPNNRAEWDLWLQDHPASMAAAAIRAGLEALAHGIKAVHILDAGEPSALLTALLTEEGCGLLLCRHSGAQWLADSSRYFHDSDSVLRAGFAVERKRVVRF
ncbi:amino acid kinase family protein [Chitinimonas naiadis]